MGSLRVRHDWATSFSLFTFMLWRRKRQPTPVLLPGESQGRRSQVGFHHCLNKNDAAAATAKSLRSCLTLCDPIDGSPPGSTVPGILQLRRPKCVAISLSNAWKWNWMWSRSVCPTLCNPIDCSPPGSSVHGIFQARVLEWGATAFSTMHNYYTHFGGKETDTWGC